MKIGLFTDAYFPIISGVSISVDILQKELIKLGHDVYVICNSHEHAEEDDKVIRFSGKSLPMKGMHEYKVSKVTRKRVEKIGSMRFDVIHCHTEFTMGRLGRRAAKKFNIPVVHTYHTMYEDYCHFISKTLVRPLRFFSKVYSKSFANSADSVVFPTIKVKKTFDRYGFTKKADIIPTGIYTDKFRKINFNNHEVARLRDTLGIAEDDFVMLFLGRLSREKSIETLIRKFALLSKDNPKLKLLLVGGGPDGEFFENIVNELKLNDSVIFTGMVPPDSVALYYHVSDVFCNFSTTETQGLTFIEALASGLPLLAKYDDNLEDVLRTGFNGISFEKDEDFIQAFHELTSNRVKFTEISNNASKAVEKFSAQNYAKNIEKVYKSVLSKK